MGTEQQIQPALQLPNNKQQHKDHLIVFELIKAQSHIHKSANK